jgi:predicted nucleic acid-binding protein
MSRIFWDTNLFIYLFEDYKELSVKTIALRRKMLERGDHLLTSTMTLGEILVGPRRRGDHAICRRYEEQLSKGAVLVPFDVKAAKLYAQLRSERSLMAPDAIQLACAASANVDLFVTNDERLQGRHVEGIQFIVPLARVPI